MSMSRQAIADIFRVLMHEASISTLDTLFKQVVLNRPEAEEEWGEHMYHDSVSIHDVGLLTGTRNALDNNNLTTCGHIYGQTKAALLKTPNLGPKRVDEILEKLWTKYKYGATAIDYLSARHDLDRRIYLRFTFLVEAREKQRRSMSGLHSEVGDEFKVSYSRVRAAVERCEKEDRASRPPEPPSPPDIDLEEEVRYDNFKIYSRTQTKIGR